MWAICIAFELTWQAARHIQISIYSHLYTNNYLLEVITATHCNRQSQTKHLNSCPLWRKVKITSYIVLYLFDRFFQVVAPIKKWIARHDPLFLYETLKSNNGPEIRIWHQLDKRGHQATEVSTFLFWKHTKNIPSLHQPLLMCGRGTCSYCAVWHSVRHFSFTNLKGNYIKWI